MSATNFDEENPDPMHNVTPYAQDRFGDFMDLAEDTRRVPEIGGISVYATMVSNFLAEQAKDTGQQR